MASLTQWPWVWVNSGSWWWTGRPGVLQFMGLQRVGHNWATELNWTENTWIIYVNVLKGAAKRKVYYFHPLEDNEKQANKNWPMQQIILEANNPRNKEKAYIEKPQYMMTYIHQTNQSQNKRAQNIYIENHSKNSWVGLWGGWFGPPIPCSWYVLLFEGTTIGVTLLCSCHPLTPVWSFLSVWPGGFQLYPLFLSLTLWSCFSSGMCLLVFACMMPSYIEVWTINIKR